MSDSKSCLTQLSGFSRTINTILGFDPQLIFCDTFDRIYQELIEIDEKLINSLTNEKDYWIVYDVVISLFPVFERLIFSGYSDQILEYLINLNEKLGKVIVFRTSRFVPFRLQLFTTICSAFANTQEQRDKDATLFIQEFKEEMNLLKHLEESNVNGLEESVTACNKVTIVLSDLFNLVQLTLDLMNAHFNKTVDFKFTLPKPPKQPAKNKKKGKEENQEEQEDEKEYFPIPELRTVNLIINAFNSPLPKKDYCGKYGQILQAWSNPNCQLAPSLLHRLIFSFLKSGSSLENIENLVEVFPDDLVIQLGIAASKGEWLEVSEILAKMSPDEISKDYQFFGEIAFKLWNQFSSGQISDPMILKGVHNININLPSPCPLQTGVIALNYCWHLDSQEMFEETINTSASAIAVIESYRDIYVTRQFNVVIPPTSRIPTIPHDQNYISFGKWIECLHTDLLTIWIRAKLKFGTQIDIENSKAMYSQEIEATIKECAKTKELYGILSTKQKTTFDSLVSRPFKPPTHSNSTEQEILATFKSNNEAKALLFTQMAFFRPKRASQLLEKARQYLYEEQNEYEANNHLNSSPIIYKNRKEVCLLFNSHIPEATYAIAYGKEILGSNGLTTQNTSLKGAGIKQDLTEPFVISQLKPNTSYSLGFGAYDKENDLIDGIIGPYTIVTCHSLSKEMIWSYIASASFQLGDMASFDVSLTYLLKNFVDIAQVLPEHSYMPNENPFNRFILKPETFEVPAPILRAFTNALIMASRLFASSRPMNATSFLKPALLVASTCLQSQELVLSVCNEILAVVEPLLVNAYYTQWAVSPLLHVINSLNMNISTSTNENHQSLVARCSLALEIIITQSLQEPQLSSHIVKCILDMKPNEYRSQFITYASKKQILDSNITGNNDIIVTAAEIFRHSKERSFDELFSKFKNDNSFAEAAVYILTAAHNAGLYEKVIVWGKTALEHINKTIHDFIEKEKKSRKTDTQNSNMIEQQSQQSKKKTNPRAKKNEPPPPTEEELAEINASSKIKAAWNNYRLVYLINEKFNTLNKFRAALNLLIGMCLIENNEQVKATISGSEEAHIAPPQDKKLGQNNHSRASRVEKQVKKSKEHDQSNDSTNANNAEESNQEDENLINDNEIVPYLLRAIVLGSRSNSEIIVNSAVTYCQVYLSIAFNESITGYSQKFVSYLLSFTSVLVRHADMTNSFSIKLLQEILLLVLNGNQLEKARIALADACENCPKCSDLLWIVTNSTTLKDDPDLPSSLISTSMSITKQRDISENHYRAADNLLKRSVRENIFNHSTLFTGNNSRIQFDSQSLCTVITKISDSLQKKQKISYSISLIQKLAFVLLSRGDIGLAIGKINEALEGHFKVVNASDRIDSILGTDTEEVFYQKHSWSGCLSISVLCSLLAYLHNKRNERLEKQMLLIKLAIFSISSLFANSPNNPKKSADFADFEPTEIVPGFDIFMDNDPKVPFLEPPPANICTLSFSYLLSALMSYDYIFEMFKPLSLCRHFFRYIIRDKKRLTRARLLASISCSNFGFISSSFKSLNDVITGYGESSVTKESLLYPSDSYSKRINFDGNEPPTSNVNIEAIKAISTPTLFDSVTTKYGFSNGCLFSIAVSRLLLCIASSVDPTSTYGDPSTAGNSRGHTSKGPRKAPRPHHKRGKVDNSQNEVDVFDICTKSADQLISNILTKDFNIDQLQIKYELMLEQANIYMALWRWEEAADLSRSVLKDMQTNSTRTESFSNTPIFNTTGLTFFVKRVISISSYNLNNFENTEKVSSPYIKSLLLIRKADFENAVITLINMISTANTKKNALSIYCKEYILANCQLITLYNYDKTLIDVAKSKISSVDKANKLLTDPLSLITKITEDTFKFFNEQLMMCEDQSYYIRDIFLLPRLKHLEAVTNFTFNGPKDSIELLAEAQAFLQGRCPYVMHGLNFLLNSSCARLQMQILIKMAPFILQQWNTKSPTLVNMLNLPMEAASPEMVEKVTLLLHTTFAQSPDCIVHPASQQCVLDLSVLAGYINSNGPYNDAETTNPFIATQKRLEHSLVTLTIAHAVRNAKRHVQSLISSIPDGAPSLLTTPLLLLNEYKGQKVRNVASGYYSHVCSLTLPIFDEEFLEMRTLMFFRCFEEQCTPFKTLQSAISDPSMASQQPLTLESGQIVGQWYAVDSEILNRTPKANGETGDSISNANSKVAVSIASRNTRKSYVTNASTAAGSNKVVKKAGSSTTATLKGILYFFIGIIVSYDETAIRRGNNAKKTNPKINPDQTSVADSTVPNINGTDPNKLTPILIAAQVNDLRTACNEMAEVVLEFEESKNLEIADANSVSPPSQPSSKGGYPDSATQRKKSPSTLARRSKSKIAKNAPPPQPSILKRQAELALQNAELKWSLTLQKAESVFNKSNRIIGFLAQNRNRWPNEVKLTGVDINTAASLSHFFNTQLGINEKAPQLADWLVNNCSLYPAETIESQLKNQ